MKLDDLKPAPFNPRRISPEALDGLRASLRELGDISGITWNKRTGHLVCGHQRVEALRREFGKALMMDGEEIRTPRGDVFRVRVVDWDEARERLANVTANSPEIAGTWNEHIEDLLGQIRVDFPDLSKDVRIDELLAGIKADMEALSRNVLRVKGGVHTEQTRIAAEKLLATPAPAGMDGAEIGVVDFSGGRDSTMAALWSIQHLPKTVLLYVDMGVEYPGFSLHVMESAIALGSDLEIILPRRSWWEGFRLHGWPCRFGPWCQDDMHKALADRVRAIGPPEKVLRITGSKARQASASSKKTATSTLFLTPEYRHFAPVFLVDDETISAALELAHLPTWNGYGRGIMRSCCFVCPGQRPATYLAMSEKYPELYEALLNCERQRGNGFWNPIITKRGLEAGVQYWRDHHGEAGCVDIELPVGPEMPL